MNKHDVGGIIKSPVKLRFTKAKKPVLNLLIQTTDTIPDAKGRKKQIKDMHSVKFWGPVAETVAKHYTEGEFIVVSGRSETKPHPSGEGYIAELVVKTVENIKRSE